MRLSIYTSSARTTIFLLFYIISQASACNAETYCKEESWIYINQCYNCPAGYSCPGQNSCTTNCYCWGTYWASSPDTWEVDNAPKQECPPGRYSTARSNSCTLCPGEKIRETSKGSSSGACVSCESGISNDQRTVCFVSCEPGQEQGLSVPEGQLQDAFSVRLRTGQNTRPTFSSDGVVSGKVGRKSRGAKRRAENVTITFAFIAT